MTNRVVVACFGDKMSTAIIERLAISVDVIAVAMDFSGVVPLGVMRDAALDAGALRCHVLDVREEFARERLLPALHADLIDGRLGDLNALAHSFASQKLEEIARLEDAMVEPLVNLDVAPRPRHSATIPPLQLEVAFHNGIPVSVNGVDMTLTELLESLETITGEPAVAVLSREIERSREPVLA